MDTDTLEKIPTYYVILPVRNSVKHIKKVMDSMLAQSIIPKKIKVIDDGSTDGTGDILDEYARKYDWIEVRHTDSTCDDFSRLVIYWNESLEKKYDYHMIMNGDIILEPDYVEIILGRMTADPKIVVASGVTGTHYDSTAARGACRFVNQEFFYKFYEKYPYNVTHESQILFMAVINGYKQKSFSDVLVSHEDAYGHRHALKDFGSGMKVLGYNRLMVLARVVRAMTNEEIGISRALGMLCEYIKFKPDDTGYYALMPQEFRRRVNAYQKRRILSALRLRRTK